MVITYRAPVSLTSVLKTCHSPDLERADFNRQSFQYTWLNSYFLSSVRESNKTNHTVKMLSFRVILVASNQ